jgi:DNA primase
MWRLTQMHPTDPVYRYMTETRRYSREMLNHYNVSYCEAADPRFRPAQGRVIFPIIYDGVTVGWQGRWPADGLNWGELNIPKYYTMPGMRKGQILYNYDNAKDKPFVIVCEGVTDVHAVGDHAVAVLGKAISSTQRQRLLTTWRGKPILLLLDPDARREMEGMLAEMMHIQVSGGGAMFPVVLPDGRDPADYDRVTIQAIIQTRAREVGVSLAGS